MSGRTDSVPFDRWDLRGWETMRRESDGLRAMLNDWMRTHDYAMDFGQDVFNLLQKGAPTVRHPLEMDPRRLPIRAMIAALAEMEELDDVRRSTIADPFNAATAMVSMREFLTEVLEAAWKLQERANAVADAGGDGAGDLLAEAESTAGAARATLRRGLDEAATDLDAAEAALDAYGQDPDAPKRMSFDERAALARRLAGEKLRRFARLIGAWRRLAAAEARQRFNEGSDEVAGLRLGDDLANLTVPEMLNLAMPATRADFWRRWAEGTLLVNELRSRERVGRGPILVLADESGSMAGAGELWAKGLALALLDQARDQSRDFTYLGFGGEQSRLREFTFPAGRAAIGDVLDMVEGFLNAGSTSLTPALARALDLLAGAEVRPDVVLVTDGIAPAPRNLTDWTSVRQRLQVQSWGVYASSSGSGAGLDFLSTVADDVRLVTDLLDPTLAADILRSA